MLNSFKEEAKEHIIYILGILKWIIIDAKLTSSTAELGSHLNLYLTEFICMSIDKNYFVSLFSKIKKLVK